MKASRYALFLLCLFSVSQSNQAQEPSVHTPNWKSVAEHYQCPEWFRDAKFGIYTHWGPVTVGAEAGPNGVQWYGRNMYRQNSPTFEYHLKKYGEQKVVGYKEMIAKFNPTKFDADKWAELFAASGARFAGPVVIHHDNYAMWDSAVTRWDSQDTSPQRDFTAELETAIRKHGMKFIATFHHSFSWNYFDGAYDYDGSDPQYADLYGEVHKVGDPPSDRFLKVWLAMIHEVVDKYEPDLIWFDFGLGKLIPAPYQMQMFADYYNRAANQNRQVGVAHKHWDIHEHAGIIDFERGRMDRSTDFPWLTDTSVGPWFNQNSEPFKNTNQLIDVLVDIVSKNGCMLLNVGPTADGEIPSEAQSLLREMGQWLRVNGEAIYATRPWLFYGEGPTQMEKSGGFSETNERQYTARDIRYTQSKDGKTLYAIALDWPGEELLLGFVDAKQRTADAKVSLLGSTQAISYRVNEQRQPVLDLAGVQVEELAGKHAFAFRLEGFQATLNNEAKFSLPGSLSLEPAKATLEGRQIKIQENEGRANIGHWNSPDSKAHWLVKVDSPGSYQIRGEMSCRSGPSRMTVSVAAAEAQAVVPQTDSWFKPQWVEFGQVTFDKPGVYHLILKPSGAESWKPINLYQLQMAPAADFQLSRRALRGCGFFCRPDQDATAALFRQPETPPIAGTASLKLLVTGLRIFRDFANSRRALRARFCILNCVRVYSSGGTSSKIGCGQRPGRLVCKTEFGELGDYSTMRTRMIDRMMVFLLMPGMALLCVGSAAEPNPDPPVETKDSATGESGINPIAGSPTGRPLSSAMQRAYRDWPAADDRDNEFFTNFKYSRITGIGKDPYVSRRDPSKVIKHDGKYYVWYTRRETVSDPVGIDNGTDKFPALDWDLAEIHYATSTNGFDWQEQGVAVPRAPQGQYGDRSLTTTDILIFKGKYYLYYQTFTGPFRGDLGDRCDVSLAWADSPDGPWTKAGDPVVPLGGEDEWDGGAIHDPFAIIYQGKVWLFYKGEPLHGGNVQKGLVRAQGVALADKPEGPFVKHGLNPLLNSGHETCVFPWKEGLVALVTVDGPEKNTVQYAPNGMDFKPVASLCVPPYAPGPYCPDVFADNGNGMGIKWGLAHISEVERERGYRSLRTRRSFLVRFDCDLRREYDNPYYKNNWDQVGKYSEETFFHTRTIMDEKEKQKALQETQQGTY